MPIAVQSFLIFKQALNLAKKFYLDNRYRIMNEDPNKNGFDL